MQQAAAYGLGAESVYDHRDFINWCDQWGLDSEDTASAVAYEDWWVEHHGVEEHTCPSVLRTTGYEATGYCDVCRA